MEEKIWHKHYPKGVNREIDPEAFSSLVDFSEQRFKKFSSNIAFINMGKSITYAELDVLSKDFAAYLQNHTHLQKGDRIAIQMPNLLQYVVALFGAMRAGLVIVNINPLYTAPEMAHQLKDSGAKGIVILSNFAHNLEKIIKNTAIETTIVTNVGDMLGGLKGAITNFVVKYVKKMVPSYHLPNAIKWGEVMAKGAASPYTRPEIDIQDIAFLQYTGGTTGVSKGAMLTHRNMIANMEQIREWMKPKLFENDEVIITALPLYHIFALTVNCFAMMTIGARNVLITNPRDMPAFCGELEKYPFTLISGVNTLFIGLMNQERFRKIDFSSFKICAAGGMAVQKAVAEQWEKLTGVPIVEGYGLTETSPLASCNCIDGTERIGTIGVPVCSTELGLFDENGKEVAQGERGEIWIKGPQVMKGYWQRPDETEKVFEGEWFKSGDVGVMDEDGYFSIVDRIKEMILVSGFNVYPNEVEDVIALHPKVLEVGVIGVTDDKSTESVKAFIVKKDPSLTAEEVVAHCREHMTAYKVPREVVFRDELPKSPIGKILRRVLKEGEMAKK